MMEESADYGHFIKYFILFALSHLFLARGSILAFFSQWRIRSDVEGILSLPQFLVLSLVRVIVMEGSYCGCLFFLEYIGIVLDLEVTQTMIGVSVFLSAVISLPIEFLMSRIRMNPSLSEYYGDCFSGMIEVQPRTEINFPYAGYLDCFTRTFNSGGLHSLYHRLDIYCLKTCPQLVIIAMLFHNNTCFLRSLFRFLANEVVSGQFTLLFWAFCYKVAVIIVMCLVFLRKKFVPAVVHFFEFNSDLEGGGLLTMPDTCILAAVRGLILAGSYCGISLFTNRNGFPIFGAISVTTACTMPLEYVLTQKMQVHTTDENHQYTNFLDCAIRTFREGGLVRFYGGFIHYYFKIFPVLMMVVYFSLDHDRECSIGSTSWFPYVMQSTMPFWPLKYQWISLVYRIVI